MTGDRVQMFVPPIAPPSFYIRLHAPEVFTWMDYLNKGIMEPWQVDVIRAHIHKRSNIGFSGATGSGKTTLSIRLSVNLSSRRSNRHHRRYARNSLRVPESRRGF